MVRTGPGVNLDDKEGRRGGKDNQRLRKNEPDGTKRREGVYHTVREDGPPVQPAIDRALNPPDPPPMYLVRSIERAVKTEQASQRAGPFSLTKPPSKGRTFDQVLPPSCD